jgi:hypothetical protein
VISAAGAGVNAIVSSIGLAPCEGGPSDVPSTEDEVGHKRLVDQTAPGGLGRAVLGICKTSCNMGQAAGDRVGRALKQEVGGGLSMLFA